MLKDIAIKRGNSNLISLKIYVLLLFLAIDSLYSFNKYMSAIFDGFKDFVAKKVIYCR